MNRYTTLLAVLCVVGFARARRAQLPSARMTAVFPPGGQRGTSVEVTVTGADLDDLKGLHFSNPALTAEPKKDPNTGAVVPNVFVVRIGKDVRPGAYDVRAVGRFGVTNPRAFVVDREPHAAAKPGNTSPEAASELALNTGAYAQAAAAASQFFRVNLKAGRRVFVDVDAAEIDSLFEPVVVAVRRRRPRARATRRQRRRAARSTSPPRPTARTSCRSTTCSTAAGRNTSTACACATGPRSTSSSRRPPVPTRSAS